MIEYILTFSHLILASLVYFEIPTINIHPLITKSLKTMHIIWNLWLANLYIPAFTISDPTSKKLFLLKVFEYFFCNQINYFAFIFIFIIYSVYIHKIYYHPLIMYQRTSPGIFLCISYGQFLWFLIFFSSFSYYWTSVISEVFVVILLILMYLWKGLEILIVSVLIGIKFFMGMVYPFITLEEAIAAFFDVWVVWIFKILINVAYVFGIMLFTVIAAYDMDKMKPCFKVSDGLKGNIKVINMNLFKCSTFISLVLMYCFVIIYYYALWIFDDISYFNASMICAGLSISNALMLELGIKQPKLLYIVVNIVSQAVSITLLKYLVSIFT